jgi:hypothetical protein
MPFLPANLSSGVPMTEDEKQKYFEEGYDQCYREVISEIETWKHPDTKSLIMWLSKTFKSSHARMMGRQR